MNRAPTQNRQVLQPEKLLDFSNKLFGELFGSLNNPQRDRSKGLGLGLTIVDRLCQRLQHPLQVFSRPGKGSVFKTILPRGTLPASAAGVEEMGNDAPGLSILLVDDDMLAQEALTMLLKNWGCQVRAVATATQALDNLTAPGSDFGIDLVITDYRLPQPHNGLALITRIRERLGHIAPPTLLISGDTAPALVQAAQQHNVPLLLKPVSADSLGTFLRQLRGSSATCHGTEKLNKAT